VDKRRIVDEMVERGVSQRMACRAVGLSRSSQRYQPRCHDEEERARIRDEVVALAHKHRRYGYRRITALLRRQGERVNHKRIWRLWRQEGLSLPRKRPRKRRVGDKMALPTQATHRGHVWTYDFVFDRTERRELLKMLVVLDEYTRECHAIKVGRRLGSEAVIVTLEGLCGRYGAPEYLRSDNGGEFIAARLKAWLARRGTQTVYIDPGHPWENGYAESFIGKFRDECLNEEVFWGEKHAQVVVERWRTQYNKERPHSSLGYQTPAEMALGAWLMSQAVAIPDGREGA
jgi:putative transposase